MLACNLYLLQPCVTSIADETPFCVAGRSKQVDGNYVTLSFVSFLHHFKSSLKIDMTMMETAGVELTVCLCSLSCWKVKLQSSFQYFSNRFSFRFVVYSLQLPCPWWRKPPHSMIPPLCGIVWCHLDWKVSFWIHLTTLLHGPWQEKKYKWDPCVIDFKMNRRRLWHYGKMRKTVWILLQGNIEFKLHSWLYEAINMKQICSSW